MFLINLNAEIVAWMLSFRKSRHKPNLESTPKYGFSPDLGENGVILSMRMQVILDSSFARPGWAPIYGREERRVQGLDYHLLKRVQSARLHDSKVSVVDFVSICFLHLSL